MNETMNILLNRCSVRSFKDEQINEDIINSFIEAGLKAASGGNLQPLSIIKITDEKNSKWFVDQGLQGFISKAPLNLLFCLDFNRLKKWAEYHNAPFVMDKSLRHFWISFQDVIIAAQSIETAANSYGVGSVYIGTTVDMIVEIQEKFNLPKGVIPIVLLTMGYPKNECKIANKLSKDIVVHNESYQEHTIEFINEEYFKKYGEPQQDLTDKLKTQIIKVVNEVDGPIKQKQVEEYLSKESKVSTPMRYFGLHYVANYMAKDNTGLLKTLDDNGLIWASLQNHPKK
ncbi:hypothetical protein CI105_07155 [Candidatus Izimaplasma bacterium ZiA1]|uniref:nitroreductase family protein n=1 Tax=Candidatus Izimoplasma sp. ZiA1 TaxID=2024899 RepID=UPI000BAA7A19|nr:hypothetical protein CI105_07155 [Candidatus Izimaplasma bacterium ZiA1]